MGRNGICIFIGVESETPTPPETVSGGGSIGVRIKY